jgi:hypothetical protein
MFKEIRLTLLETNDGQIAGLPANPRQITEQKLEQLKRDIEEYPEMLNLRGLMVYPYNGKYVIIGGNMRYRAMSELGMETAPCVIIPEDTDVEHLKAYTILDNNGFGQWDFDRLANEWDDAQLTEWGVDLPVFEPKPTEDDEESEDEEQGYKIAYELVFNDEAEQTEFYHLLRELKNNLQDYDTISERMLVALRFWRDNYEQE